MGTKRKVTLADVQGPQGKPRLSPPGGLSLPRGIRPSRYEPKRDPLNFALLSKTLENIAGAVGEKLAENEEEERVESGLGQFGINNNERSRALIVMQSDDEPIPFFDLRALSTDDGGPIGFLDNTTLPLSPELEEKAEVLANAIRTGQMPPTASPTARPAIAQLTGKQIALGANDVFRKHLVQDGTYVAGAQLGTGGPAHDFNRTIKEAYYAFLRDNPILTESEKALREFDFTFLPLANKYSEQVKKSLALTMRPAVERVVHGNFHASMKSILDPANQPLRLQDKTNPDRFKWYDSIAARKLDAQFDLMHKTGADLDSSSVKRRGMVTYLKQIAQDHRGDFYEVEERIQHAMNIFERMMIGNVSADKDHLFLSPPIGDKNSESVEFWADKLIQGSKSRGRGGASQGGGEDWVAKNLAKDISENVDKYDTGRIADDPTLPTVYDGGVATGVNDYDADLANFVGDAKKLARTQNKSEAAINEIGLAARNMFTNQVGVAHTGASTRLTNDLLRDFNASGDADQARLRMNQLVVMGFIKSKDRDSIRSHLDTYGSLRPYIGPGSMFADVVTNATKSLASLGSATPGGLGLPPQGVKVHRDKLLQIKQQTRTNLIAALASAHGSGEDPTAALNKVMSSGPTRKLWTDYEDAVNATIVAVDEAKQEILTATANGKPLLAARAQELKKIGGLAITNLLRDNKSATQPSKKIGSVQTTVKAAKQEVAAVVRDFMARQVPVTAEPGAARKHGHDIDRLTNVINYEIDRETNRLVGATTGADYLENIRTGIKDFNVKLIAGIAERYETMKDEAVVTSDLARAKANTKGIGKKLTKSRGEFEKSTTTWLKDRDLGLGEMVAGVTAPETGPKSVGGLVFGWGGTVEEAFNKWMSSARFKTKDRNSVHQNWRGARSAILSAIAKETGATPWNLAEMFPEEIDNLDKLIKEYDATDQKDGDYTKRNQLLYNLVGLAGEIPMEAIEEGSIKVSFVDPFKRPNGIRRTFTIDLTKVEINPSFVHFETQKDLDEFINDPKRYGRWMETLTKKPWDPDNQGWKPRDTHNNEVVQSRNWIELQEDRRVSTPRGTRMGRTSAAVDRARVQRARIALMGGSYSKTGVYTPPSASVTPPPTVAPPTATPPKKAAAVPVTPPPTVAPPTVTPPKKTAAGSPDPLSGELGELTRPDGSVSTEISVTVEDSIINNGKPTNIPLLVKGQIMVEDLLAGEDPSPRQLMIAMRRANERGGSLPSYDTIEEAVEAAKARSAMLSASRKKVQPKKTKAKKTTAKKTTAKKTTAKKTTAKMDPPAQPRDQILKEQEAVLREALSTVGDVRKAFDAGEISKDQYEEVQKRYEAVLKTITDEREAALKKGKGK